MRLYQKAARKFFNHIFHAITLRWHAIIWNHCGITPLNKIMFGGCFQKLPFETASGRVFSAAKPPKKHASYFAHVTKGLRKN